MLYPPQISPGRAPSLAVGRRSLCEDARELLQERLAEFALLFPRCFRISTLGRFLRERFGYSADETSLEALRPVTAGAIEIFCGVSWEEHSGESECQAGDSLLSMRVDPLGDLTQMLSKKLSEEQQQQSLGASHTRFGCP